METALAKLQSQQTYLTSMFNSMSGELQFELELG